MSPRTTVVHGERRASTAADAPPEAVEARGRRPGRPRDAEADQRIRAAALDQLARHGVAGTSIEAIAADAGVAKTTIYRRWPNKEALIIDAFAALDEPGHPVDETTSVRDQLVSLLDQLLQRNLRARADRLLMCVIGESRRHPELFACYTSRIIEPRRERMRAALRRGMAAGELRRDLDVDLAVALLTGPVHTRTLLTPPGRGVPDDWATQIVDVVLDGLRPR